LKIFGIKSYKLYNVKFRVSLHVCLFFCFIGSSYSQELPPVLSFSPKDYQADNQNWSITQVENKHIYIANNKGLLEYDGGKRIKKSLS